MSECLVCANLQLKSYPRYVAVGMGRCSARPLVSLVGIGWDRPCPLFVAAPEEKADARKRWWLKRDGAK